MAQWKQDPQSREDIEEVSKELELPIYKASALGKFRPWLKESWGKLEDYLINLKNIANSKEPAITKKSGFNLDKTNLTENDSNKLFTAKGALDLFNTLTTNFTNAVNTAKEYFRTELVKKIDKTSISSSLTSTSTATVLSSAGAKNLEDKKLNISDAWKNFFKPIGNENSDTNLNDIMEPGEYSNAQNLNKFTNSPVSNKAFTLSVQTINANSTSYRTQILSIYNTQEIYKRIKNSTNGWSNWWRVDSGDKLPLTGGTITGPLTVQDKKIVVGDGKVDVGWSGTRYLTTDGFLEFEVPPTLSASGQDRCNIKLYYGGTEKYIRFPTVGNGQYVAYQEWVNAQRTWENVSGKPSVFNPASHTHSWAELNGKPNFVNVVDSTSTTDIATPRSVKLAYDKGVAALTEAQKKENAFAKNTAHNKNFGTTAGTVLEGNKIDQITGKTYGGILNTAGAKTAGKTYWDNNTKKLFLCKNNNSDTSANVNNYIALDNNSLLDRLENLNNSLKIINTFNSTLIMENKTETDTGITIPSTCLFVSIEFEQMYSGTIRTIFSPLTLLKNTGYNYSEAFHSGGEYWQRLFFKVNTANKLTYTADWNSDKFKHAKLLKVIIYGF